MSRLLNSIFTLLLWAAVAQAAVSATHLTTGSSTTDSLTYTTASITPGSNQLVFIAVAAFNSTTLPGAPTISGNGLTWEQVTDITFRTIANPKHRLSLFRSMGASPSTESITITYATTTPNSCAWSVVQFDGVDTTGTNGSGAIVQSATNRIDSASSLSVTLAAFADANNATYGSFMISANEGITPGSGFTEFGESQLGGTGGDAGTISSEYQLANDTGVDASWTTTTLRAGGIAVEIKAAAAGGAAPKRLLTLGVGI